MRYYILILPIMLSLLSCLFDRPSSSNNYFYTKLFTYSGIATNQKVTYTHIINDTLGFLLATDEMMVEDDGGSAKDQSAILFRTSDGGRAFEKKILGKGQLDYFTCSADNKNMYMLLGQFTEYHDQKPTNWILLRSIDLGNNWEEIFTFEDKWVTEVCFFDDKIGFAFVLDDPIGYDVKTIYKTEDGGKSWKLFLVNTDELNSPTFTKEKKLLGLYSGDDILSYWQMDLKSMKPEKIDLENLPEGVVIRSFIECDPITGSHYLRLVNFDIRADYLYCLETKELLKVPSPCYDFNIYGDYIGMHSAWDKNKNVPQYRYSTDKGKTWTTETPPGAFPVNPVGLYGEGQFWMMCMEGDGIQYPLMVRIPAQEEK